MIFKDKKIEREFEKILVENGELSLFAIMLAFDILYRGIIYILRILNNKK